MLTQKRYVNMHGTLINFSLVLIALCSYLGMALWHQGWQIWLVPIRFCRTHEPASHST